MKAFDLVWTCFIFPFPKQKRTQKKRKGYLLFLSSVVETDNHTCSKLYISIRTATNTQTAYQYFRKNNIQGPYETKEQTG